MKKFSISPYESGDEAAWQKYIKAGFHEKYILGDLRYLNWQFGGQLYVAKNGNEIIGHFGCRDLSYKIYEQSRLLRVLMNLSVAESYRLSGAAAFLAEKVFDTSNPIMVSDARPAAHALFNHLRSGWKELGRMKRYLAVVNPSHALFNDYHNLLKTELSTLSTSESDFLVENVAKIDAAALENFWERARHRYPVTVERTSEYLSWRFWKHPFFRYQTLSARRAGKLVGYLIWRIEEDQGFKIGRIIDFVAAPEAEPVLLSGFLSQAKLVKADAADFFFSGNFYKEALARTGFFDVLGTDFERFPMLFSPISNRRSFINLECDFETTLNDFYATKADGDQDRPNPH